METMQIIAWISVLAGGLSFIVIYVDINMGRYQAMPIMNLVWPITALYLGPLGVWAYWAMARAPAGGMSGMAGMDMSMEMEMSPSEDAAQRPITFKDVFISGTHCGAGCTVADILSETVIFVGGITLFGAAIWAGFVIDYFVALAFGVAFQYYNIVPMRNLTPAEGIKEAFKADVLSLTAFQVGMYAWMLVVYYASGGTIAADNVVFWWMMQIAMGLGLLTNLPVNYWLIRRGIKTPCA